MALKKSSKFEDLDSGLFEQERTPEIIEDKPVERPVEKPGEKKSKPVAKKVSIPATGTRLTISFKPETYRYVTIEARRRGMTISKFINQAMEEYKVSPNGRAEVEDWL